MELNRRKLDFRKAITILYIVAFSFYLFIGFRPADATAYEISNGLAIPSINLISGVTSLELKDRKLDTPSTIVGSYSNSMNKTFLIGHSSTVFQNLKSVKVGESIYYDDKEYKITEMQTLKKSDVDMGDVLKAEDVDTVVIMTCAGETISKTDATHRLLVTAVRI